MNKFIDKKVKLNMMKVDDKVKLCIVLLFMACLVLVSVGSACASDSVSVDNFTDMNTAINNGSNVSLAKDITGLDGINDGIVINRSTTVDGCGHFIDANGTGRFFQITDSSAVLTLKNITLKNGYRMDIGGAIYSSNDMNLILENNVVFDNNTADVGGAIASDGNVNITCTNGNISMNNNNASGAGTIGANGNVTITCTNGNISMNNNNASGTGGAIGAMGNVIITVTNGGVSMNNNIASDDGGAIYSSGDVTITAKDDILFANNYANSTGKSDVGGGAISAYSSNSKPYTYYNVTLTTTNGNIIFRNNTAGKKFGGAILGKNINITANSVSMNNNNASGSGGAISSSGNVTITAGIVCMNNNNASGSGGAIRSNGNVDITADSVCMNNNNAGGKGGAIYSDGNMTITAGSVCMNNNTAGDSGGAIYSDSGSVTITCTNGSIWMNNNTAHNSAMAANAGGGVIYSSGNVTITADNVWMNNNTAYDSHGGIIYAEVNVDITADSVSMNNNTASRYGGAINTPFGVVTITCTNGSVCMNNNTAGSGGGAIYSNGNMTITADSVCMNNNTANTGGAIYSNGNVTITADSVSMYNNTASMGGAITANTVNITNAVFYGNDALNGTAIAVFDFENSNLTHNYWGLNYKNNQSIINDKTIALVKSNETSHKIYVIGYVAPVNWVLLNLTASTEIVTGQDNIFQLKFNILTNGVNNWTINDFKGSIITKTSYTDGVATAYPTAPGNFSVKPDNVGDSSLSILNIYTGEEICKVSFNVVSMNSTLNVIANNITEGEEAVITIILIGDDGKTITDSVNLTVNNVIYSVNLVNGMGKKIISGLTPNEYIAVVKYAGDATHNSVTNSTSFVVSKPATKEVSVLKINSSNVVYGDDVYCYYTLTYANGTPIIADIIFELYDENNVLIGSVVKSSAEYYVTISNASAGFYTVKAFYKGDDEVQPSFNSTSFNIAKANTELNFTVENVPYGKNASFIIKLDKMVNENVTVVINNQVFNVPLIDGSFVGNLTGYNAGNYVVWVSYNGNENYTGVTMAKAWTVSKVQAWISYYIENITYGENATFIIQLTHNITDYVYVSINGQIDMIPVINGRYEGYLSGYDAGVYSMSILYPSSQNYYGNMVSFNWLVNQVETEINTTIEDISYGETGELIINMIPKLNTTVNVLVNGKYWDTIDLIDGYGVMNLTSFNAGIYYISVLFSGDNNYKSSKNTTSWIVNKVKTNLNIETTNITYGDESLLTIIMDPKLDTNVTLFIDGNKWMKPISLINGFAQVNLTNLDTGKHVVVVKFYGNDNYKSIRKVSDLTVEKANTTFEISTENITTDEEEIIKVFVGNNLDGFVYITGLSGKELIIKVIDGMGTAVISNLVRGNYTVTGVFVCDNVNYNNVVNSSSFTVVDDNIYLKVIDLVKYYGNKDKFEAILVDGEGNYLVNQTVVFTINGVSYNRVTDNNGVACLSINLNVGEYPVKVTYEEIESYATVNILTTINANDTSLMYRNGTKYEAIFTDSDGKVLINTNISFNINGVFYTRTTDNDGKACLNINLQPGEYVITCYNSVTGQKYSNKITVKPTLVGSDLTKKYSEQGAYTVVAYDNQGRILSNASVTININGVFYTKVTDSSGVARLNINLLPGEYVATASFNGFSTSNKITVLEA